MVSGQKCVTALLYRWIRMRLCLFFVSTSRLTKTDMELEVLRYTNRVSSDAHKMVPMVLWFSEATAHALWAH